MFLSVMHCQSQCQCILTVDYIAETRKGVFRDADVVKSFTFHPKPIHCMSYTIWPIVSVFWQFTILLKRGRMYLEKQMWWSHLHFTPNLYTVCHTLFDPVSVYSDSLLHCKGGHTKYRKVVTPTLLNGIKIQTVLYYAFGEINLYNLVCVTPYNRK